MLMNAPLAGKVALVTGAGKNIGRAIALRLAADGAAIVVNGRSDEAAIKAVAEEITAAGGRAMAYRADITKPEEVAAMAAAATGHAGRKRSINRGLGASSGGSAAKRAARLSVNRALTGAAIVSVLVTLVAPAWTRRLFTGLNLLTYPIAWLVRLVLLGLIFTLVVTPIGLCLRLRGHDALRRRRPAPGTSLWKTPQPKGGIEGYFR